MTEISVKRTGISNDNSCFLFSRRQFIYLGGARDTTVHAHQAIQIAVSFNKPFVIHSPGRPSLQTIAAIVDSDQPHQCETFENTRFMLINLAPETKVAGALRSVYLKDHTILPRT